MKRLTKKSAGCLAAAVIVFGGAPLSSSASDDGAAASGTPKIKPDGREEVIFSSTREETMDGEVLWSEVVGDLDAAAAQRAGRPWTYLHEDDLFREEAWSYTGTSGTIRYGYRVVRTDNPSPVRLETRLAPPSVDPALEDELAHGDPSATIPVSIDVRGMPRWNVPLRPTAFALAARDLAEAEEARLAALELRRERGDDLLAPVAAAVEALGGEVVARGPTSGWLTARVPASSMRVLLARPDLRRVSLLRGRAESHASIRMDDLRSDSYIDARPFLDAGYTGEAPNPSRHGFGDVTVGVVEIGQLENEACFLYDGADCAGNSRLQELFRCDDIDRDGNYCEPVSDFLDNDKSASHGTFVTSVVMADYTQGQGNPYELGDGSWTPGADHDSTWENENTGIAREARVIFFGQMADNDGDDGTVTSAALADAFDDAIDRAVDITNSSWGWNSDGGTSCSLEAVSPHEQEAENAFDDGILMVVSAGNPNDGICRGDRSQECSVNADCAPGTGPCVTDTNVCNIGSPADLPKTLAINALNGAESACQGAYTNCLTDPLYSANGGIDATVDGSTCSGCVTGISLTAPNRICGATSAGGLRGNAGACFNGTSAAAPVVAGAAALVKDQYLSNGQTFINNPGRLHAVMLAMGDRHEHAWGDTNSSQKIVNASRLMGTGRLKMRLLENGANMDPWGNSVVSASFTASSGDHVYYPWSDPMPAGAEMVKCVAYQVEDMSDKTDISRVDLEVRLKEPVTGSCFDIGAPAVFTRIDGGTEIKKVSAIESSEVSLRQRCVEVTLDTEHVTSQGVTVITNCYYAGVGDDVSAPGT